MFGATMATRMMAAKPSEDAAGVRGQIELFRNNALGNFRDLLVQVAQDPAMLVWLDGISNTKAKPQENFGRELMELFTMGVGHYTEADVYAAARVFTGWNLRLVGSNPRDPAAYFEFLYRAGQHDTDAKEFTFPIYPDGGRTIPARSASAGMQDGLDLIEACARHPETGRRLARKLWGFFISELHDPDPGFVDGLAAVYLQSGYDMRVVVRTVLESLRFNDPAHRYARYSWPVEMVVRAVKEIGWAGFSVNSALSPLSNMGQQLFEPPDVAGWAVGRGWVSTGAMLERMNFAATLSSNQKFNIANDAGQGTDGERAARLLPRQDVPGPLRDGRLRRPAGVPARQRALDRLGRAERRQGPGARPPHRGVVGVSTRLAGGQRPMQHFTRREFIRGGVSAFA